MIDLAIYDDNELRSIVEIIPPSIIKSYFKKHPRDFQKTMPGFRTTTTISAGKLFKELKQGNELIESLVVGFLEMCEHNIGDEIVKLEKDSNKEEALIKAISCSYFASNPTIYLKLLDQSFSDEKAKLLEAAIKLYNYGEDKLKKAIKEITSEQLLTKSLSKENANLSNDLNQLKKDYNNVCNNLKLYEEENRKLKNQLQEVKSLNNALTAESNLKIDEIKKVRSNLEELNNEIAVLKTRNKQLTDEHESDLQKIDDLQSEINNCLLAIEIETRKYEEKVLELNVLKKDYENNTNFNNEAKISEIEEINSEGKVIEKKIENDFLLSSKKINDIKSNHCKSYFVKDEEGFKSELEYVIEDAKISEGKELLLYYLTRIYYFNKPIVGNKKDCQFIVNIFSSIFNDNKFTNLVYFDGIKLEDINFELEKSHRVVYLDNFIGNFNETSLFTLLNCYKDKIFIISAMYNKMFMYLPDDFLRDCSYINLERYQILDSVELNCEPCEEREYVRHYEIYDNAATAAFISIMKDLKLSNSVRGELSQNIHGHLDVSAILTFSILPYLVDVKSEDPFMESEKLLLYYEKNKNSKLALRWFTNG